MPYDNGVRNSHFIAHRREKDKVEQGLWEHLNETSELAEEFAAKINLDLHGRLLGLLHDLGKATEEFQQYIKSMTGLIDPDDDDYTDAVERIGRIDHSSAGAQVIYRYLSQKGSKAIFAASILPIILASHHSGLIDCLTPDGNDYFTRRMNKPDEKTRFIEAYSNLDYSIKERVTGLLNDKFLVEQLNQKIISLREPEDTRESMAMKIGLLTKFLFSCLIDADRLNTADFEFPGNKKIRNNGIYKPWTELKKRLEKELDKFAIRNAIDSIRQEISEQCLKFSDKPRGLYQLTVPTGGGKTLSSLRFAISHAENIKWIELFI